MNKISLTFIPGLICGVTAFAQTPVPAPAEVAKPITKPAPEAPTIAQSLGRSLSQVEGEVVPAADAMPEDKFNFAPTAGEFKGVKTYAQQVRHIAAVNFMLGAAILGEKPPVDVNGENGPDSLKAKADILKYLKDSYAYLQKALATINAGNVVALVDSPFGDGKATRLGLATIAAGHSFDHYGQMAVSLRMNGIIPPASRR